MLWVFFHTKKVKKKRKKKSSPLGKNTHSITINNISSTCPRVLQRESHPSLIQQGALPTTLHFTDLEPETRRERAKALSPGLSQHLYTDAG